MINTVSDHIRSTWVRRPENDPPEVSAEVSDGKRDRPGGISLHPVTPGSTRSHIGCAWHESTSHEGLGDCCEEVGWAAKRLRRGCEDLLGVGGSSRDAEGTT